MANNTISPNMGLVIPTVGEDPAPNWAEDLNSSLDIIDGHTHAPGFGVQINPNGIDINAALPMNGNNLTLVKTVNFSAQSSPLAATSPNIGCLYVSGNELYYNDKTGGHQVQITNGGSVNAGAGSITGLPSGTASVSYSGGTYTFQSATNTAANIDGESFILRNSAANSKGLTLNPPSAMASDITETLPAIPGSTSFMQMDTSGNMSASVAVSGGITATNIANATITGAKIVSQTITQGLLAVRTIDNGTSGSAGDVVISTSSGSINTSSTSEVAMTNLSCTLTTTGRPVVISLQPENNSSPTSINLSTSATGFVAVTFSLHQGSLRFTTQLGLNSTAASVNPLGRFPPGSLQFIDYSVANTPGTYTWALYWSVGAATTNVAVSGVGVQLVVYEM